MPVFRDDDGGYLDWLGGHRSGLVVNARSAPDIRYLVLHRATCRLISEARDNPAAYTSSGYIKFTGSTEAELRALIARELGGSPDFSKRCARCRP